MTPLENSGTGSDAVLLLAGGRSSRMGRATPDKILHPVRGVPLFRFSLDGFVGCPHIGHVIIVHRDDGQRRELEKIVAMVNSARKYRIHWALAGNERRDSVANGLEALPESVRLVFIHDCARPLVRPKIVADLARLALEDGAAGLAHRITDTVKQVELPGKDLRRVRSADLDRDRLWATETPQAFQRELIVEAYRAARTKNLAVTDDLAAVSALGRAVSFLENPHPNPKATHPRDLDYLTFLLTTP